MFVFELLLLSRCKGHEKNGLECRKISWWNRLWWGRIAVVYPIAKTDHRRFRREWRLTRSDLRTLCRDTNGSQEIEMIKCKNWNRKNLFKINKLKASKQVRLGIWGLRLPKNPGAARRAWAHCLFYKISSVLRIIITFIESPFWKMYSNIFQFFFLSNKLHNF